jgi:hypothetical protein
MPLYPQHSSGGGSSTFKKPFAGIREHQIFFSAMELQEEVMSPWPVVQPSP